MSVAVPKGTIIVVAPECISGQRTLEAVRAAGCRVVTAAVVPPEQEENILWHLVSTPKCSASRSATSTPNSEPGMTATTSLSSARPASSDP